MVTSLPLSKLVADRRNSRRVKPEREAHKKLVASIRAHGLLEPLLVRPNGRNTYHVVAGRRRLEALREIHRGKNVKVYCQVVKVDGDTAEAMSLAENFAREPMHPLEEAESFARLAQVDGKRVDAIAAEFGVTAGYVRQRMKLATLADPVRKGYRADEIDTATAEAFAAVPPDRQREIWKELNGQAPAEGVRERGSAEGAAHPALLGVRRHAAAGKAAPWHRTPNQKWVPPYEPSRRAGIRERARFLTGAARDGRGSLSA